ncbi:septation protein SepH [Leucobacter sp. UT-8R-CII-1-4]|uniref:septation protein SepH n=1 Tax=Leucobacter sp. UT-8R-CII-1-4 TaxID=3040075 RepID=UPI0024A85FFB|nr:septation protein SepH [Leucobacter sp. UT-8R-CII-1-4]MDI6024307.1 septation protein SepH [Leucobacter sp. UT-8R-CII-1-4]
MDELRVVRREDQALIVATEAGDEYRLIVDSSVLADLRHLARQANGAARINPREIQSLVRAGKSRAEIMQLTGAEESDIERYEEPVLAERRFILSSAQSVQVRTSPTEETEEQFGSVIAERLIGLQAKSVAWTSWRDDDAGWMIGLDFDSYEVSHHAVWSFDHRKSLLSPLTPDAVTLSKQSGVGDRLIPKLRAVDSNESGDRFDSDAFDRESLLNDGAAAEAAAGGEAEDAQASDDTRPTAQPMSPGAEAAVRAGHPSTGSIPIIRQEDEFARRREIDQRAIKTTEPENQDLGQTADLLDALRRRRGARDEAQATPNEETEAEQSETAKPVSLTHLNEWRAPSQQAPARPEQTEPPADPAPPAEEPAQTELPVPEPEKPQEAPKRGKGRASIPSWDDILFGTRSEEDPN